MSGSESPDQDTEKQISELAQMVRLNGLIHTSAVTDEASVVHIEPGAESLVVRFRVANQLHQVMECPKPIHRPLVDSLKFRADMDVAERRVPQTGQYRFTSEEREFQVEASTFPCLHGEKLVLHLLELGGPQMGLDDMSLSPENLEKIQVVLSEGSGIMLFAGGRRSGKTTNLYTCVEQLSHRSLNIFTIEESITRRLERVNQMQLNFRVGLTGETCLRALKAGDPDVIMLQRIQSSAARLVLRAYRPGRLVLAGCYDEDAAGAVVRLTETNQERYLVAKALKAVWAQVLLCQICSECRQARKAPAGIAGLPEGSTIYEGVGCPDCHQRGHRGLVGIQEVLVNSSQLQEAILRCAPLEEIQSFVQAPMRTDALDKLKAGQISLLDFVRAFPEESD